MSRKRKASEMPPPVDPRLSQGPRWVGPKPLERLYVFYGGLTTNWRDNLSSRASEQL